jgi:hypothetical protein
LIDAAFRSMLAHDFNGAPTIGSGHGLNFGRWIAGVIGIGASIRLDGSRVGEPVPEHERRNAVPLEPLGHHCALGIPCQYPKSAARGDYGGRSSSGFPIGQVNSNTGIDYVPNPSEASSVRGLGFFSTPVF